MRASQTGKDCNALEAALAENANLRKQLEEVKAHSAAQLQEFDGLIYTMFHELAAPNRAVKGFSTALKEGDLSESERHEFVERIYRSSLEMEDVRDAFGQIFRDAQRGWEPEDVSIGNVIANARAQLSPPKTMRWILSETPPPVVWGCESQLTDAFREIFVNSFKFSRQEVPLQIEIRAESEGGNCLIKISDNGIGIDPELAWRLFVLRSRLPNAEQIEGVGVGLVIVRRIITRHGGHCSINGQINVGTTVSLSIPVAKGHSNNLTQGVCKA